MLFSSALEPSVAARSPAPTPGNIVAGTSAAVFAPVFAISRLSTLLLVFARQLGVVKASNIVRRETTANASVRTILLCLIRRIEPRRSVPRICLHENIPQAVWKRAHSVATGPKFRCSPYISDYLQAR